MKKSLIAGAVLAAIGAAVPAAAQSNVTLYGLLDTGVENLTHAGPQGSATRVSSGGMNNSRFGFRGTEDLGGGLKAIFQLEGGLLTDIGGSDGGLFRRQANVGLEGSFGRVVLGRSFTTVYDFIVAFDPMAYAPYYSWASSGSASGVNSYGMITSADNIVKYSIETGPVKFGATYAFGEQSTGTADGARTQLAATYTMGNFAVVGSAEQGNGNNVAATNRHDSSRIYHLGGMVNAGDFKVQVVARSYKNELNNRALPDVRANTYWAGLTYKASPAMTLVGAVFYTDVRNVSSRVESDPKMYITRARYALSKRTDLYVTAAYAKAKNNQVISLSRNDAGFADTQRGLMAGVQHRF
ncbi:porin [Duganella phyllosphaerae]|uniref:Outer membrane porin protein 32 n=1 Tax=Duganella phyllosphaerae TaxID=762836 RepID=A0A1E7X4D8_9BURK|nr:porin [Duganella phyllosphaerae]OFA07383.1 outer membrane porin protein 32 precursor [Duganella phyllosphaerae]